MMRKRFTPSQSFGASRRSSSMVSSTMDWVLNNKVIVAVAVVAIVAFALGLAAYLNEPFRNKLKEMFGSKKTGLKELDVLFFMSPTCSWCKKMKKVLNDEGTITEVTLVDVTKPEGQELAKKFGAVNRGIPNFISRKLNTGTVGYKKTTQEVVDALTSVRSKPGAVAEEMKNTENETESPVVDPQDVAALSIVVFTTEGCPWCKKAKADAENLGIMPYLEFQDLGTPDGKMQLQNTGIEFKGAPTFYSRTTGKTSVGYRPFNEIITNLVSQ